MMRVHLASIRRFHPDAPILVSKRGGGREEMEGYARDFGIRYWLEDCGFTDAYFRLLERIDSQYVCIIDHDAVLLSSLDPYVACIAEGKSDLVGIEERIRLPDAVWKRLFAEEDGWLRFAPGCTTSNFLVFDWRAFKEQWGLRGVWGGRPFGSKSFEFDYGIGQKLARHHFLLPYHTPRYGIGNLLKDGDVPVVWHQWYGSYRERLQEPCSPEGEAGPGGAEIVRPVVEAGELAFLADYPSPDFSVLTPAWGPERDIEREQSEFARESRFVLRTTLVKVLNRARDWKANGAYALAVRALARLGRWWRYR